ncbi:hypothetical protein P8452_32121 [Trifolium repens]|nr:hypothetical protein P8452_32121 [Trifolium repens]
MKAQALQFVILPIGMMKLLLDKVVLGFRRFKALNCVKILLSGKIIMCRLQLECALLVITRYENVSQLDFHTCITNVTAACLLMVKWF